MLSGGRRDRAAEDEHGLPEVWRFGSVGSTNDVARLLADRGAPAGTTVIADEQRAGRGRGGRSWASPAALGAWLSVVVRPTDSAGHSLVPLAAGLAAARILDHWLPAPAAGVKWPNDLVVGGRKIAGVLCEASWQGNGPAYVVVGIGINVLQREDDFAPDIRRLATSIYLQAGSAPQPAVLAPPVAAAVVAAANSPPAVLDGELARQLASRDALVGRSVVVSAADGEGLLISGTAMGITPDGALLLRTRSGVLRRIRAGTVRTDSGAFSSSSIVTSR